MAGDDLTYTSKEIDDAFNRWYLDIKDHLAVITIYTCHRRYDIYYETYLYYFLGYIEENICNEPEHLLIEHAKELAVYKLESLGPLWKEILPSCENLKIFHVPQYIKKACCPSNT